MHNRLFIKRKVYLSHSTRLLLARDHLGQKPFFYAHRDGRLLFASEIKALTAVDDGLRQFYVARRQGVDRPGELLVELGHEPAGAELREVVEACLTPDREQRTWSAADVLAALRRVPTELRSWAPEGGSAAAASPEDSLQFERQGYFVADRQDHRTEAPVFNRSVTLRDTWATRGGG